MITTKKIVVNLGEKFMVIPKGTKVNKIDDEYYIKDVVTLKNKLEKRYKIKISLESIMVDADFVAINEEEYKAICLEKIIILASMLVTELDWIVDGQAKIKFKLLSTSKEFIREAEKFVDNTWSIPNLKSNRSDNSEYITQVSAEIDEILKDRRR